VIGDGTGRTCLVFQHIWGILHILKSIFLDVKGTLLILLFSLFALPDGFSAGGTDSLLRVLDRAIGNRQKYTEKKERAIDSIKQRLDRGLSSEERFRLNGSLIAEYQSFKCDSALAYVARNIEMAKALGNVDGMDESRLKQAFVLSLSGLFAPALETLQSVDYQKLPRHLKVLYCWSRIRYNENLMKYMDSPAHEKLCLADNRTCRDSLMGLLGEGTDMYRYEEAFRLSAEGAYEASAAIRLRLFEKAVPHTHAYAMSAMGLASVHKELNNVEEEEHYLLLAAITDVRLAVKENEALLALAIYRHRKGDVGRAFNYIQASLEDANFYNSRFRNAVIARTYPIIEATYRAKIEEQKKNLRLYALAISMFVAVLATTLYFLHRQVRMVSMSRKKLGSINAQLLSANRKLDEANLIRERYIGYYISRCAAHLDRLDQYRKYVHRKIKAGQIESLKKLSASDLVLERDTQTLYRDFDETFFEVYPNFVEEFNALLRKEERYDLKKNQLNTELRIFALMRLGITDVSQIASFLRYSTQTIYNYKSKVKGKALTDGDPFEERVKKIGGFNGQLTVDN